jgi:hypothetical protein
MSTPQTEISTTQGSVRVLAVTCLRRVLPDVCSAGDDMEIAASLKVVSQYFNSMLSDQPPVPLNAVRMLYEISQVGCVREISLCQ